jgi:hypothetical protein
MSARLRHGRAAFVDIALAALLAADAAGSAPRDAMITLARAALPKL